MTASQVWRNCQKAMKTYPESTRIEEPEARPSSPSVRFTAFDAAESIRNAQTTNTTRPSFSPVSRMNERSVDVPATFTVRTAKPMATNAWPATFAAFDSPSDRRRETLM